MHLYVYLMFVHLYTYIDTAIHIFNLFLYLYTYIDIYIYTYMPTHMHPHTRAHTPRLKGCQRDKAITLPSLTPSAGEDARGDDPGAAQRAPAASQAVVVLGQQSAGGPARPQQRRHHRIHVCQHRPPAHHLLGRPQTGRGCVKPPDPSSGQPRRLPGIFYIVRGVFTGVRVAAEEAPAFPRQEVRVHAPAATLLGQRLWRPLDVRHVLGVLVPRERKPRRGRAHVRHLPGPPPPAALPPVWPLLLPRLLTELCQFV